MSKLIFLSFAFLFVCILLPVQSYGANRTYLIKKDFIAGFKGGEFSIYDPSGKIRQYRMESKFGATHDVRLFDNGKKLLARLKAKITAAMYKASLTIFDSDSNEWVNGTIEQNYKFVGNKFTIIYDSNRIVMEGGAASLNTDFLEQPVNTVLAKFQKRVSSLFWRNKYDLQVLTNKYPDALFFLGVAARDHSNKKIWRG